MAELPVGMTASVYWLVRGNFRHGVGSLCDGRFGDDAHRRSGFGEVDESVAFTSGEKLD